MSDGWSDARGLPVDVPEAPPSGSHYAAIGDFQGVRYARNAFARGTAQEVAFLARALDLRPGQDLLDVGCGDGRHTRALARQGLRAVGVDLSGGLLTAAACAAAREATGAADSPGAADHPPDAATAQGPRYLQADARALPLAAGSFDVALSLCQGGFGVTPAGDATILRELHRVLRPTGRLALTAFSLAFAARWMTQGDAFHVEHGLHHQLAEVRGPDDEVRRFDLWTSTYSAPHLRLLVEHTGFHVDLLAGVEPGAYGRRRPSLGDPELLVLATRR